MRLAVNSVYSIMGAAVPMVVSIVTVPLYMGLIGGERYGALMIAWLLLGYFGQADFGIARAITQRIASSTRGSRAEVAEALWSGIVGVVLFSIFSAMLVYAASSYFFAGPFKVGPALRQEMLDSRIYLSLCIPVIAITSVFAGALMGLEKFKLVTIGNLASSVAMQIVPLLLAYLYGANLKYLIAAAMGGRAIGLIIAGGGAWMTFLRGEAIRSSWGEFHSLFRFGVWILLTMIIGPMMTMADRFVIGATLGAVAVAVYAVPFQIASRTVMFPFAISQVLFPRFASDSEERSLERCRDSTVLIGQLYAPMVIGLACLAAPLLKLWIGKHLDVQSIIIGQIILVGFWVNAIAGVPYGYIQARGNPRYTALLHVAELPVYTAALYILGRNYGLAGVAAAFSLRCAADCALLMLTAKIWSREVLGRLAPSAVLVLAAVALGQWFQSWLPAFAAAVTIAGLAAAIAISLMPVEIQAKAFKLPILRRFERAKRQA